MNSNDIARVGDQMGASAQMNRSLLQAAIFGGHWNIKCRDKHGNLKWEDTIENIVVNQGLNDLLDVTLSGATQDTTWFVGLLSATPTVAAGDTLASHAGWTEVTAYDEVNRVAWVDAGASSQAITNAASPAVFTISANGTDVGGAFLAGVNTGTSGRLFAAGAFTAGNKSLDDNDTLEVTAAFSAAAA